MTDTALRFNCLLTGIGGQGIVLASRLLAHAFMARGATVRVAETIGMSQRGGTVVSHVRMAENAGPIHSSMLPLRSAQLILAFEPGEAARAYPYLAAGGLIVTALRAMRPVTASLKGKDYDGSEQRDFLVNQGARLVTVDGDRLTAEIGNPKVLNTLLLGAAIGQQALPITREEIRAAIAARVKPHFAEINYRALDSGIAHSQETSCP